MTAELRKLATGAAVLADWLGSGGKPVPQALAEQRAAVCVDCPENRAPRWWERSKSVIARNILLYIEAKKRMKLATGSDDKLHMCQKCGCHLPTKVWCPIEHIAGHTDLEKVAEMPAECWQRREIYEP